MKFANKIGIAAALLSVLVAIPVLIFQSGRVIQEGFILQFGATAGFVYAGIRGSHWWFATPLAVVLFWVTTAHIGALWN